MAMQLQDEEKRKIIYNFLKDMFKGSNTFLIRIFDDLTIDEQQFLLESTSGILITDPGRFLENNNKENN